MTEPAYDQPLVQRNDWRAISPPALEDWTPSKSVSVVIPGYGVADTLPYVLASLAAQTYPAHLLELVVVDDGSTEPLELPEVRPEATRLLRVTEGWGCAGASHLGVESTDGEVLFFLDADMLVFRDHIAAQLRWHDAVDYAVVLGHKRFVDPGDLVGRDPAEVRDIVAAGAAETLWDWEAQGTHKWVEGMWRRTDDLTTAGPRAFRSLTGPTMSLTRSLYAAAGGYDTSLVLGEDTELAHRLSEAGGVLVPEYGSRAWHLGTSQIMRARDEVNRHNDSFLANLVPTSRPKRNRRGRQYDVPYLEVLLAPDWEQMPGGAQVIGVVDAVLDSSLDDLRVVLVGPWSKLDDSRRVPLADPLLELRIVERTYRPDGRVELVEEEPPGRCRSPLRLTLDGLTWAPQPDALLALVEDLERTHEGVRVLRGLGVLERTAAVSRARRVGAQDVLTAVAESWGGQVLEPAEGGFVPLADRRVPRHEGPLKPPVEPSASLRQMRATRQTGDAAPGGSASGGPASGGPASGGSASGGSASGGPASGGSGAHNGDPGDPRKGIFGRLR